MASVEQVVSEGLCSGCGACQFAAPGAFRMEEGREGWTSARKLPGADEPSSLRRICPFSGDGMDEDDIGARLWPALPHDPRLGRHKDLIACYSTEDKLRMAGGSGALVSWLALELLRRGEIDGVIHVHPASGDGGALFRYDISWSADEIRRGAKSRYYSVTMADVLTAIADRDARFALIGVPCFIKAARLLVAEGHLPRDRIPYFIGLVCGHLKSRYFADYLAWQKGLRPGELTAIDFREKLLDRPASDYGFRMVGQGRDEVYPMSAMSGRDWGEGLFRLPACEYCDDVLAECADIAIGDAWLPAFVDDPKGTNIAVVRDRTLSAIIAEGRRDGALFVEDISADDIAQSQAGGLRHRREGLAHRLARRLEAGRWIPRKRVAPALAPDQTRRRVYDLRLELALISNSIFADAAAAGNIALFERRLRALRRELAYLTKGRLATRVLRRMARVMRRKLKGIAGRGA